MSFGVVSGSLEELCEIEYGTRVVRKRDGGSKYPVYGGGGETFFLDSYNREDRVVVARFAMSLKCTRQVLGKFALNDSGLTLSPKNPEILSQRYLDYLILSLNDEIYQLARGTAQKNLNMTAFRQVQITFPNSLELQEDVTSRLDTLISNIDSALVASSSRNQAVEGLLKQELAGVFYQNVNNWPVTTIGDKCDYKNGKAHEQLVTKDGEYRLVTSKFVSTQGVSARRVSKALTPLHDGDVAFVLSDLPNGKALAKAYLVESEQNLTLNQRVLRIKSPEFDPLFLYFQVNRHPYLLSFDNGESQTHLKLAQVLSCPLVIPDLDVQRSVGRKFLELEKLGSESELLAQSKSEKLEDLKKSLLIQFLDPQYLEDWVA